MFSTNLTRMPSSKIHAASVQALVKALVTIDPKKAQTPLVNPEPMPQTIPLAADYTYVPTPMIKAPTCLRCGRQDHTASQCHAKYDVGGHDIE
jgi:surfactin synthase thioesterase subunit